MVNQASNMDTYILKFCLIQAHRRRVNLQVNKVQTKSFNSNNIDGFQMLTNVIVIVITLKHFKIDVFYINPYNIL